MHDEYSVSTSFIGLSSPKCMVGFLGVYGRAVCRLVPFRSPNWSLEAPIFGCDAALKSCVSPPRHYWLKSVQGESLLFIGVDCVVSRVMLRLYRVATLTLY
jgi:hypothetical protein